MFELHGARSLRLLLLAALALVAAMAVVAVAWVGRAAAEDAPAAVATAVSNVQIPKADAVTGSLTTCTTSNALVQMPGMSETFTLGGTGARPVIVLFQALFEDFAEGGRAAIQLTIDGTVQSDPSFTIAHYRPAGTAFNVDGTRGFNFVTNALQPGTHTARILWRSGGGQQICVDERSLIVLHR